MRFSPHFQLFYFNDRLEFCEFFEWKIKRINNADLFSQPPLVIFTKGANISGGHCIRNSWRTNLQLIRSIGNMIGYKKSLSEWQCLSEVKMGRGSPIPPMLRRKIVAQYQKGVSQRKIAKSLKLSSSTVHNIIQRFRESGTISVRKGQGRKNHTGCPWSSGP